MEAVIRFLSASSGDGSGSGSGSSDGYGYDSGYDYGDGDGAGDGSGYGDGYGSGNGSGSGDGSGYGNGNGSGYGDGDGSGSGDGSGFGSGYGYGSGSGSGSGYGDGSGDGDGISEINEHKVHYIDGIPTVLYSVHVNYAQGGIVNSDLTVTPCYIARAGDCFAHGKTFGEALEDATEKALEAMPLNERIAMVIKQHPDIDEEIPHRELYDLHHLLTGSCTMGRNEFAKEHGLAPEHGSMTMRAFIHLTIAAYGGDAIRQLAEAYELNIE